MVFEDKVLNVVSGNAPAQISCEERNKEEFWWVMDEVVQGIPGNGYAVISGDMNGHVSSKQYVKQNGSMQTNGVVDKPGKDQI